MSVGTVFLFTSIDFCLKCRQFDGHKDMLINVMTVVKFHRKLGEI